MCNEALAKVFWSGCQPRNGSEAQFDSNLQLNHKVYSVCVDHPPLRFLCAHHFGWVFCLFVKIFLLSCIQVGGSRTRLPPLQCGRDAQSGGQLQAVASRAQVNPPSYFQELCFHCLVYFFGIFGIKLFCDCPISKKLLFCGRKLAAKIIILLHSDHQIFLSSSCLLSLKIFYKQG